MTEIFKKDPNGAIAAFERMMRKQISMPAMLMDDQTSKSNIFIDFSAITQKIGVYTTGLCGYHRPPCEILEN